jgi:pimeloyl-ACP methyl ester carboxylesterase
VSGDSRPGDPEKLLLRTADGVALPALLLRVGAEAPTAVVIDENGAQSALDATPTPALRESGWNVLALDLRGWGETRGNEHLLATDSLLWGKPLVTQRALDLLATVAHLRTRSDLGQPLVLLANGPSAGVVCLVASALGGGFAAVAVNGLPESLLDLFDVGVPADCAVWNLLTAADVPHLKALSECPIRSPFGPVEDLAAWARQAAEGLLSGSSGR